MCITLKKNVGAFFGNNLVKEIKYCFASESVSRTSQHLVFLLNGFELFKTNQF